MRTSEQELQEGAQVVSLAEPGFTQVFYLKLRLKVRPSFLYVLCVADNNIQTVVID